MMIKDTARDKILQAAAELFQFQGYHATGINQIIKNSGTPKGSLYHYFPGGKEELAVEAIRRTYQLGEANLRQMLAEKTDPIEAVEYAIQDLAVQFHGDCKVEGVSIGLIALETSMISEPIRKACLTAFEGWQAVIEAKFIEGGIQPEQARETAQLITMMLEGAFILAVSKQDKEPILLVAKKIRDLL